MKATRRGAASLLGWLEGKRAPPLQTLMSSFFSPSANFEPLSLSFIRGLKLESETEGGLLTFILQDLKLG